jgi:hypothetical protein
MATPWVPQTATALALESPSFLEHLVHLGPGNNEQVACQRDERLSKVLGAQVSSPHLPAVCTTGQNEVMATVIAILPSHWLSAPQQSTIRTEKRLRPCPLLEYAIISFCYWMPFIRDSVILQQVSSVSPHWPPCRAGSVVTAGRGSRACMQSRLPSKCSAISYWGFLVSMSQMLSWGPAGAESLSAHVRNWARCSGKNGHWLAGRGWSQGVDFSPASIPAVLYPWHGGTERRRERERDWLCIHWREKKFSVPRLLAPPSDSRV